MGLVKLWLDDREVTAPEGSLLIEAAAKAGVEIPSFCYYPGLKLQGACRMCLVEVKGLPKLATACTMPVAEGMVVRTDSPSVKDARRAMLEFVLTNHPMDCPVCDKGGECELQDATFSYGAGEGRFIEIKQHRDEQQWSPVVYFDRPRCILCYRCVRICDEGMGLGALAVSERACPTTIFPNGLDHLNCDQCGMCIDICPVGALTSGMYRYHTRPWEMKHTGTVCAHCADGCTTTLGVRDNKVVRGSNRVKTGVNGEFLCIKGRYASDFNHHDARLRQPLRRVGDCLVPISWAEALDAVARRLQDGIRERARFGVIGSTRTTNEENYLLRRIAVDGLGTPNLDHHRTGDLMGLARALRGRLGGLATTSDVYTASAVIVLGSDLSQEHPMLAYQVRASVRHHGSRVYVVTEGPVREDEVATVSLRAKPGDEIKAFSTVASRLRGEEDLVVLVGGAIRGELLQDLVDLTDELGIPAKFVCLMDYSNSRGAADMGLIPDTGGLSASEMLKPGVLEILWVVGANPLKSSSANGELPYLIVQDLFLTETAARADLILPAASVYEKTGTVTNTCGEVQWLRRALDADGSKTDLAIFGLIARRLGLALPDPDPDPERIFRMIQKEVPGYDVPIDRLKAGEAIQTRLVGMWPESVWEAGHIEPARNTLFTSGTLGRYSAVLSEVMERNTALYSWSGRTPYGAGG